MSGHSKWATTKRAKALVDAKRAGVFTKFANTITIAAREKGQDPETNFSLRLAIEKARSVNMPKENIERALKRGAGVLEGEILEEIRYEGFGPGGVAIIIDVLTNSRNRSVQEIKHLFSKHGGNMGAQGSVAWMFDRRGSIALEKTLSEDEQLWVLDQEGVHDISAHEEQTIIICDPLQLAHIKDRLESQGMKIASAEYGMVPKNLATCAQEELVGLEKMFAELDTLSDVTDYYSNCA